MGDPTSAAPAARAKRASSRPVVLVLDDCGYEFFDQLAATLRRRGIGCIRLTSAHPEAARSGLISVRRLRDRLFYDRCVSLARPDAQTWLETGDYGRFRILDILISETTAGAMGLEDPLLAVLASKSLACSAVSPAVLLDKFELNARLEAAGLSVPTQLRCADYSFAEATQRLGLPLIVKARTGLAGDGVRVVRSSADFHAAAAELRGPSSQLFFQRFIAGPTFGYGALIGPQGPVLEHGFAMGARQWSFGPGLNFVLQDDPALLAAGRRMAKALGCRGLVHFEFLRSAGGELWPIDANLRPWDELSLLAVNVDYPTGYVRLLLDSEAPGGRLAGADLGARDAAVYPPALYAAARDGSPRFWPVAGGFARMCLRGPGLAYGALVGAKTLGIFAAGAVGRFRYWMWPRPDWRPGAPRIPTRRKSDADTVGKTARPRTNAPLPAKAGSPQLFRRDT